MPKIEDNNAFLMAMGDGSRIEIHAKAADKDSWTQISETAEAETNTLTLAENTGWQVGDKIAIAASGFDMDEAEEHTIIAVSADGKTITLEDDLEHDHFGEIKTYDNGQAGVDYQEWDIDMRAEVALLSRNVTIQGDADSEQDGYGGHTMVMAGADMHIDGAEFTNMGQESIVGRYALHWHVNGDVSGQYVTNSSIHHTFNKGMTVHGTQNTWIENNAIYDTIGHSYYLEDGAEFGNVLMGNLGMNTRKADSLAEAAIGSDFTAVSTYWITNPNNHLIDNHASGSEEAGFWILGQSGVDGESEALFPNYVPAEQNPGIWDGNSSHSNDRDAFFIGREFHEDGPNKGEVINGDPKITEPFAVDDFTAYKNGGFGLWIRNANGDWTDVKLADNRIGAQFWGNNTVSDSLVVGESGIDNDSISDVYHGWVLYDRSVHFEDVHFEGFDGVDTGAIAQGVGRGKTTTNSFEGLTFGDDTPEDNYFKGFKYNNREGEGLVDGGGAIVGAIHDQDGSLTGQAGAIITPGIVDVSSGLVNIVKAANGLPDDVSGFNYTDGAIYNETQNMWLHSADSVIGKMVAFTGSNKNQRPEYTVERSDNGAKILFQNDAQGAAKGGDLNVDAGGDVTYTFEFTRALPDEFDVDVRFLPEGASVNYVFKDMPNRVEVSGATQVQTAAQMASATETVWMRDGNDILVKTYADRFFESAASRGATGDPAEAAFSDPFRLLISNDAKGLNTGEFRPEPAPANYIETADLTPLPDRADSTSDTVEISDGDPRWSNANAWGGGTPGAGDIVIINEGQRMVLDADATVQGIIVNGGELVVEDEQDLALSSDWILVINGGLFQVGTEGDPFEHDFVLTLEGDDKGNDIDVAALMSSDADDIVRATGEVMPETEDPVPEEPETEEPETEEPLPEELETEEPVPEEPETEGPETEEPETGEVRAVFRVVDTQDDTVNDAGIADGATLDAANLGIVVEPDMLVGSAVFYLDGEKVKTENVAPYALFGDKNSDFNPGDLEEGEYILEVIFYENSGGKGDLLGSDVISFEIAETTGDPTPNDDTDTPDIPPPLTDLPNEEDTMDTNTSPNGTADIDPNGLAAWADQILFHFDGNNNDIDDIAAIPVATVLAASAGITDKITFFHGNNITEDNNNSRLPKLDNAAEYAESFGIRTVDYQDNIDAATAQVVEMLTSGQNVLAIEGGPMEAIYRALEQTPEQFHDNIKLLSHSGWNENRSEIERPGVTEARTWDDIADDFPGVDQVDIASQNNGVNNNDGFYNRNWDDLDDATDDLLIDLRDMMLEAGDKRNDPSDAGMLFYALTGIEEGTAQEAIAYITGSGILDDTTGEPEPNQDPITVADAVTVDVDGSVLLDVLANDVDPEGGALILTDAFFEGEPGVTLSVEDNQVRITPDRTASDENRELEFFYTVADQDGGTGFERVALTITNDNVDPIPNLVAAINAGGDAFTSSNGIEYAADALTRGREREIDADIARTDEDGLYTTARMKNDNFTYEIDTGNGTFDLELNFAHMNGGKKDTTGERLVDVFVEDELVFDNLDVESEAGKRAAFDLVGEVEVTDGALTINIQSDGEKAVGLNGLSVWGSSGDLDGTFIAGSITDDLMLA
ncbi:MAG: malectin domain-containing carbohydrate-binding protein [Paracoccaceae bacterium]